MAPKKRISKYFTFYVCIKGAGLYETRISRLYSLLFVQVEIGYCTI